MIFDFQAFCRFAIVQGWMLVRVHECPHRVPCGRARRLLRKLRIAHMPLRRGTLCPQ
jgi:hypothetical protein